MPGEYVGLGGWEWFCDRNGTQFPQRNPVSHYLAYGKGQIICPDQGAVAVDAPVEMKRTAAARLPPETPAGNAAVGIFFAQNCPSYVTPAARQLIHTFSQFRARREAWGPYTDIKASIMAAAKTNRTRVGEELSEWCTSAEPRILAREAELARRETFSMFPRPAEEADSAEK